MKNDIETISQAVELALLRLSSLKTKCEHHPDKKDVVDDLEIGLSWLSKKVERLQKLMDNPSA